MDGSTLGERRATMTFITAADEMAALRRLAEDEGTTKTAVLRRALRLYRMATERAAAGHRLVTVDKNGAIQTELLLP